MSELKVGDRVKVTLEGTVRRVPRPGGTDCQVWVRSSESCDVLVEASAVEKLEPDWQIGDLVKVIGYAPFFLTVKGWVGASGNALDTHAGIVSRAWADGKLTVLYHNGVSR